MAPTSGKLHFDAANFEQASILIWPTLLGAASLGFYTGFLKIYFTSNDSRRSLESPPCLSSHFLSTFTIHLLSKGVKATKVKAGWDILVSLCTKVSELTNRGKVPMWLFKFRLEVARMG